MERSGQSVTASDFGSNGPRFESGWLLRWVLGQGSLLPLSQGEAFTLASISYLAILVKYILAKKKKKKKKKTENKASAMYNISSTTHNCCLFQNVYSVVRVMLVAVAFDFTKHWFSQPLLCLVYHGVFIISVFGCCRQHTLTQTHTHTHTHTHTRTFCLKACRYFHVQLILERLWNKTKKIHWTDCFLEIHS